MTTTMREVPEPDIRRVRSGVAASCHTCPSVLR
jgi:hypothetical protein